MNIHISLRLEVVPKAVALICTSTGHQVVEFDAADLVLSDDANTLLSALKAGKRAAHFILDQRRDQPLEGLSENFPELFFECGVLEGKGYPGFEAFIDLLKGGGK